MPPIMTLPRTKLASAPQFYFPRTVEDVVAPRRVCHLGWWGRWWSRPRLPVLRQCSFWSRPLLDITRRRFERRPLGHGHRLVSNPCLPLLSRCSRSSATLVLRFLDTETFCGTSHSRSETQRRSKSHTKFANESRLGTGARKQSLTSTLIPRNFRHIFTDKVFSQTRTEGKASTFIIRRDPFHVFRHHSSPTRYLFLFLWFSSSSSPLPWPYLLYPPSAYN